MKINNILKVTILNVIICDIINKCGMMNLEDILCNNNILDSINKNLNFLLELIPELKDMIGFLHKHPHHHLDVWNHTLCVLNSSENDFEIRLCLLLHDIGKPHCFTEGEVRHFKDHPSKSAIMSKNILERLGYDEEFIKRICYLIEFHDTPITSSEVEENFELQYKRYLIQKCDVLAHHLNKLEKRKEYLKDIETLFNNNLEEFKCMIK